jgi:pimeloyl-ACP methyl ester carboxylesterase
MEVESMQKSWSRWAEKVAVPLAVIMVTVLLLAGCDPKPVYMEPIAGTVCRWDFQSSVDSYAIPCSVYLPKGYDPAKAYPLWVEIHALYGIPILDNDPNNPFSSEFRSIADERGWIIVAPWGRNLHSLFIDGLDKSQSPYNEPHIFDDFSSGVGSWQSVSGTWAVADGRYTQTNRLPNWHESMRLGSEGKDYSVRVKVRDLTPEGTTSAFGVNLRRADNGDCYHVDLYRGLDNKKYIRLYKIVNGEWQGISTVPYDWQPLNPLDNWINLKFSCYKDYLEVYVNEEIMHMQPGYDSIPYGDGFDVPGTPLAPGEVSLCSFGGVHEFDDVRIQNEYEYGESDVLDCVLGAMEKYRVDPSKVYVTGHSQGGAGAFSLGLHNPDLCAALRTADGFTDFYYDYGWLKTNYPPNPGAPYANTNDGNLVDYIETLAGGEPSASYPQRMSVLNGSSARYILENGLNNYWRILHGANDNMVPNSHEPVEITWWAPWFFLWAPTPAPDGYTPATPTYANGKDIADLLQAWSSSGGYYCEYVTSATGGHGFLESYTESADFFTGKSLNRRPSEVAYKTYDDVNTGAWWLRLQIPNPGLNQPGMARVKVNSTANSAAVHARNLIRLSLDLEWMGLSNSAGKTITMTLDNNTSPNVFTITDNTGNVTLELLGAWTSTSGYTVRLDGRTLSSGSEYTVNGTSMVLNNVAVQGGHTLTITSPSSLPSNLAPNPGAETAGSGGYPANWTGDVQGSAYTLWDDLEMHGGARSFRMKDATFSSAGGRAVWKSDTFSVSSGTSYLLGAYAKARMLRGANPVIGITFYNYYKQAISTTWYELPDNGESALNLDWLPMQLEVTAPSLSRYATIQVGMEGDYAGQTSGSVWFDDCSFTAH